MIDRLATWLGANVNPGRMGCFAIGAVAGLHEAFYGDGNWATYGFALMLMAPTLADTAQAIVLGSNRRNGNGQKNGGGRAGD